MFLVTASRIKPPLLNLDLFDDEYEFQSFPVTPRYPTKKSSFDPFFHTIPKVRSFIHTRGWDTGLESEAEEFHLIKPSDLFLNNPFEKDWSSEDRSFEDKLEIVETEITDLEDPKTETQIDSQTETLAKKDASVEPVLLVEMDKVKENKSSKFRGRKLAKKDRLFACSSCEKSFMKRDHLLRHIRSHSDIKPFQCSLCNFRSKRSDNVKQHMRVHEKKM